MAIKNKDVNLMQLEIIARALGDVLAQVTFVGGCTTVLLVDEAAHFGVRETDDVDVIVDVATRVEYHQLSEKLRLLGFREDIDGPLCRWLLPCSTGIIKLDVMPIDKNILGFSNRWYKDAMRTASVVRLSGGSVIKVVNPVYFLATKFEAFADRGKGDFFSHDLEDIIFVMENRSGLIQELMNSADEIKQYLARQASLLRNDEFLNVLPGLLNNPDSSRMVMHSLNIMSSWVSND